MLISGLILRGLLHHLRLLPLPAVVPVVEEAVLPVGFVVRMGLGSGRVGKAQEDAAKGRTGEWKSDHRTPWTWSQVYHSFSIK